MKKFIVMLIVLSALFVVASCGTEDPQTVPGDNDVVQDDGNTGDTGKDDGNTGNTGEDDGDTAVTDEGNTAPDNGPGDCADTIGDSCATDTECGKCNICATGGKCVKGCLTNEDCTMSTGLKCNKKLARCTNVFASAQACGETKCPTGCCYAEKGLTAVTCLSTASAAKCGLCAQGQIYDGTACIPAVCTIPPSDNCPTLNKDQTKPAAKCFECKSGELVCKASTTMSGCSAGVLINAAQCLPAGQQCVAGVSECCSGMPCIQGYCY